MDFTTTYKKMTQLLPAAEAPKKFYQPPSFEIEKAVWQELRPLILKGPARVRQAHALCLGLGSTNINTSKWTPPKPIIRTKPPREVVNDVSCLLRRQKLAPPGVTPSGELTPAEKYCWTTTAQAANKDAALSLHNITPPSSTWEERADMVRYRPLVYESEPGMWQTVASTWDRCQSRPNIESVWRCHEDSARYPRFPHGAPSSNLTMYGLPS